MRNFFLIIILIGVLGMENLFGFSILGRDERYGKRSMIDEVKVKRSVPRRKKASNQNKMWSQLLMRMDEGNREIENLNKKIKQKHRAPIMFGKKEKIRMLSEFEGIILESIFVMDGAVSKIKARAYGNDIIIRGTVFRCFGSAKGYRVKVECDRMITPDRIYKIRATLRDHYSGADTLYPSEVRTGEEESFLKEAFSGFLGGVIDASKDRFLTLSGEVERKNAKNKILSGAMGATGSVQENIRKSAREVKTYLILNAGKKVTIYFDEGVEL